MERLLILFFIQFVQSGHIARSNNKDVIITYAGHVDAVNNNPTTNIPTKTEAIITTTNIIDTITENVTEADNIVTKDNIVIVTTDEIDVTTEETTFQYPAEEDEVIFVPNYKEPLKIEDDESEFYSRNVNIGDLVSKTAIADVMKKTTTTEPSNTDILFISGKNAEPQEEKKQEQGRVSEMHMDTRRDDKPRKKKKLDCEHVSCRNKLQSVCGGKYENHEWKYRLFLNECFFRKVNCNFKYEENRYKEVAKDRCQNVAIHLVKRPKKKVPKVPEPSPPKEDLNAYNKRRSFSSRRSLNQDANGRFCSHPCPNSCPEDYDPECAVSKNGIMKVFVNHCKLDLNSCFYGEFWQQRPLSECVGGKKADMRQNRGFISWMQKAGMINNKGKLVL